ncbi:MAG: TIM barrel protein [Armatimonadetes bacterium]|nr:TIM barrel protein [Armatimonadota bacterium]
MNRIKQSLSWWCYASRVEDPKKLIAEVAGIGFASVEMLPEELWPTVQEHGMQVAIIGGHGTLTDGLNRKESHDRIEDEILKNLDLAAANNIPSLICFSGNRGGISEQEGAENTAAGLARVAKAAEEKSINLCVELLNSKVDHADYQCDRTPWGVEVCKMVNSPRVSLLYDIYHAQIMEGDLMRTIRDNIAHIGHFHTGGNPGRNDIDDTQEIYYPAVMRAIAETDYDGFVGHEFIPKGDAVEALRKAYEICRVE